MAAATYALNVPRRLLYSYTPIGRPFNCCARSQPIRWRRSVFLQSAVLSSRVGVHELSALSPAASGWRAVQAGGVSVGIRIRQPVSPPINPWTHKPHFTQAENGPDRPAPPVHVQHDQPVAQLDRIIGNDSAKPAPVTASVVQKAAKAEPIAFMWPVSGKKVISAFGPKGGGKTNDGINIASSEGEPVWASADGEVVYVGNELQGYGNMVLIKHPGNKTTAYAHLSRAIVDKYDRVKQGDIIGYVGATGNVKEPQLHFAIRDGKDPVDPAKYLSRSVASNLTYRIFHVEFITSFSSFAIMTARLPCAR